MREWVSINKNVAEIIDEPWQMFWTEWKSESEEFKSFLLNPLNELTSAPDMNIEGDFHVSTEILNHSIPLTVSIVCTMALVLPEERRVKLMIYKHKPSR